MLAASLVQPDAIIVVGTKCADGERGIRGLRDAISEIAYEQLKSLCTLWPPNASWPGTKDLPTTNTFSNQR